MTHAALGIALTVAFMVGLTAATDPTAFADLTSVLGEVRR